MKSFLQGKKTLPTEALRPPPQFAASLPPGCAAPMSPGPLASHTGTNVEVIKEGDKVVRLVVTCACGERVEIDCLYPPGK
jgi:hypothetical protein